MFVEYFYHLFLKYN